jgi:cytochrome c peroxidase
MKKIRPVHSILPVIISLLLFWQCKERTNQAVQAQEFKKPEVTAMNYLFGNVDLQLLGEKLFFDKNLSDPEGQSCAACHSPETGWTGPDETVNKTGGVYPGAKSPRFGNRKPNSAAYSTFSPLFNAVKTTAGIEFSGGNFWDGRATGHFLGNPASDQAQGPFLNPLEQNIENAGKLIQKVNKSEYASLLSKVAKDIWKIDDITKSPIDLQFGIIGIAIAAFESSPKVSPFTSKYDYYVKGEVSLSDREMSGMRLFNGKGRCVICHPAPIFTDFKFDNLGVPANPNNPFYTMDNSVNPDGASWVDAGLADFLKTRPQYAMFAQENLGKHQTPTLRNVDKRPRPDFVKAYGHNGYFKSIESIVHFYNTRDLVPSSDNKSADQTSSKSWPKPEVPENVNTTDMGNLGLTPGEEADIVEFLKILSDGYVVNK